MKIKVVQKIDKAYYQEFHAEWIKYRSKYAKWEVPIGIVSLLMALPIFIGFPELNYIAGSLLVFGTLMILGYYYSKNKWMKERLKSNINNQSVAMLFEEDQISSEGPFTQMTAKWDYFTDVIESEKGIYLIPENGISIYLQKKSFQDVSEVQQIIKKIKS